MKTLSLALTIQLFVGIAVLSCHHTGPTGGDAPDADTDADTDTDADVDSDTDADGDSDTDGDTLDECPDPCLDGDDEPIPGCLDECGGMADIQCPSEDLECAYVTSVLDGMGVCLPLDVLGCDGHDDCACLAIAEIDVCESIGEPSWICNDSWSTCVIECE